MSKVWAISRGVFDLSSFSHVLFVCTENGNQQHKGATEQNKRSILLCCTCGNRVYASWSAHRIWDFVAY